MFIGLHRVLDKYAPLPLGLKMKRKRKYLKEIFLKQTSFTLRDSLFLSTGSNFLL